MAYSNLAQLRMLDHDLDGTLRWGNRAIALAEQLGDTETLVHALTNVGAARAYAGDDLGHEELTRSLQPCPRPRASRPRRPGVELSGLDWRCWLMRLDEADRRFATGIAFAIEHDHDFRPLVSPGEASGAPSPPRGLGCGGTGEPPTSASADVIARDADGGADDVGAGMRSPRQSRGRALRSTRRCRWPSVTVNCCAWGRSAPPVPRRPS